MQPVVAAAFCPLLFERTASEGGMTQLPYGMVFALATMNSLLIYNTQVGPAHVNYDSYGAPLPSACRPASFCLDCRPHNPGSNRLAWPLRRSPARRSLKDCQPSKG